MSRGGGERAPGTRAFQGLRSPAAEMHALPVRMPAVLLEPPGALLLAHSLASQVHAREPPLSERSVAPAQRSPCHPGALCGSPQELQGTRGALPEAETQIGSTCWPARAIEGSSRGAAALPEAKRGSHRTRRARDGSPSQRRWRGGADSAAIRARGSRAWGYPL